MPPEDDTLFLAVEDVSVQAAAIHQQNAVMMTGINFIFIRQEV
jgi:hypothetical protein